MSRGSRESPRREEPSHPAAPPGTSIAPRQTAGGEHARRKRFTGLEHHRALPPLPPAEPREGEVLPGLRERAASPLCSLQDDAADPGPVLHRVRTAYGATRCAAIGRTRCRVDRAGPSARPASGTHPSRDVAGLGGRYHGRCPRPGRTVPASWSPDRYARGRGRGCPGGFRRASRRCCCAVRGVGDRGGLDRGHSRL
jgi:hypothetical protein